MFKRKILHPDGCRVPCLDLWEKFGETAEKSDLIFIVLKMVTSMTAQTDQSITELSTLQK